MERSLKHILEAGHSLLGKAGSGSDAKVMTVSGLTSIVIIQLHRQVSLWEAGELTCLPSLAS